MSMTFDHRLLQRHAYGIAEAATLQDLSEGISGRPLIPHDLEGSAHLMPVLLDFRTMPAKQCDSLLEYLYDCHVNSLAPLVGLLIQTSDEADAIASRWNTLQIGINAPGSKVWLRLHDPRVLHQLLRILPAAQKRRVFGKAEAFTYWVGGEWVTVPPPVLDLSVEESSPESRFGRWDWERVELIGAVNRALQKAAITGANALLAKGTMAEQLMERANSQYGLASRDDLVEFAARGLMTSATFDQHPKVNAAVRASKETDTDATLADRLALLDEQVWEEIRQSEQQNKVVYDLNN